MLIANDKHWDVVSDATGELLCTVDEVIGSENKEDIDSIPEVAGIYIGDPERIDIVWNDGSKSIIQHLKSCDYGSVKQITQAVMVAMLAKSHGDMGYYNKLSNKFVSK